jgi:Helicase associated domain
MLHYYFTHIQTLSRWVAQQRKQYKLKQQGNYSTLTDEREQKLAALDFVFNTRTKEHLRESIRKRYQDQWMECYEKLLEFKQRFGHTGVPRRWAEDHALASWAMRQV